MDLSDKKRGDGKNHEFGEKNQEFKFNGKEKESKKHESSRKRYM
jgi:hypothetical protein